MNGLLRRRIVINGTLPLDRQLLMSRSARQRRSNATIAVDEVWMMPWMLKPEEVRRTGARGDARKVLTIAGPRPHELRPTVYRITSGRFWEPAGPICW